MDIVAIIPARGGSKEIPKKILKKLQASHYHGINKFQESNFDR